MANMVLFTVVSLHTDTHERTHFSICTYVLTHTLSISLSLSLSLSVCVCLCALAS